MTLFFVPRNGVKRERLFRHCSTALRIAVFGASFFFATNQFHLKLRCMLTAWHAAEKIGSERELVRSAIYAALGLASGNVTRGGATQRASRISTPLGSLLAPL